MSEYIKREDAIRAYAEILKSDKDTKLIAEMILADVPTADVVEVVRCKNCKFFTKDDEKWYCKAQLRYTKDNAYCSEGVRKDESDTTDND